MCGRLFCNVVLSVLSSLVMISLRKRDLVALLCVLAAMWLTGFHSSVSLPRGAVCWYVIVAFPQNPGDTCFLDIFVIISAKTVHIHFQINN